MLEKNEIYETEITGMTTEGSGVCKINDMAVFVPMTVIGDKLKVKIVKVLKNYAFGIIHELLYFGTGRTSPDCPVFQQCGGCVFRHVDYQTELQYKAQFVKDAFSRIGKLNPVFEGILGSENRNFYRNKAQYPVAMQGNKLVCGFYAKHSHRVVAFKDCYLHPPIFQKILNYLLSALQKANISAYDELSHSGELRHIYLRRGYHSGEIMLCFVVRKSICKKLNFLLDLQNKFPDIVSISESVNSEKTNVIMGQTIKILAGKSFITDSMCGNQIKISPQSFYQVNTAQAEQLYMIAKNYADLQGSELLLDLYCGAGIIGLSMADSVKKLIGVEVIPQAVENAKENALQNQISNAEFYSGDAGMISKKLLTQKIYPNVVILDPPRKGCDNITIQSVINMQPDKIIMISCNPATCARDSAIFAKNHYITEKVKAVDLFPSTAHVECVVLMSRENDV